MIIQTTWPTLPKPQCPQREVTRSTVTPLVWEDCLFAGALILACTPGGKGNLTDLTLLFKKLHNDVDCS